jgi:glycerol-3-phosphate acyltransferase PlsY
MYQQDIRTLGSKNAGSTNMYRVFGFKAGLIVQLLDILKGVLAAGVVYLPFIQTQVAAQPGYAFALQIVGGISAVLGHVYTLFAGFKGGKGVNTLLGMMLMVEPWGSLVGVLTFITVLLLGKMVSLGSMTAVASFPLFIGIRMAVRTTAPTSVDWFLLGLGVLLTLFLVYTHRANITRILNGTESKAGFLIRSKNKAA